MKNVKAFTMVEILIISILIWSWLLVLSNAILHAKKVNQQVMQRVIANQIATEWAEIVYQMRNTNFLKYYLSDNSDIWWWLINSCRIANNYDACKLYYIWGWPCSNNNSWSCNNNDAVLMKSWYYYITNNWWFNQIINCSCNNTNCNDIKNDIYAICLNSWVWVPCPQWHENWWDESRYWKFYRMIKWIGTYDMWSDNLWWSKIDQICYNSYDTYAQEYRFCSTVARDWAGGLWWEVEICSTMTNFVEEKGESTPLRF